MQLLMLMMLYTSLIPRMHENAILNFYLHSERAQMCGVLVVANKFDFLSVWGKRSKYEIIFACVNFSQLVAAFADAIYT